MSVPCLRPHNGVNVSSIRFCRVLSSEDLLAVILVRRCHISVSLLYTYVVAVFVQVVVISCYTHMSLFYAYVTIVFSCSTCRNQVLYDYVIYVYIHHTNCQIVNS